MPNSWESSGLTARRITGDDLSFVELMHTDAASMAPIGGVRDHAISVEYLSLALNHWDTNGFGMYLLFDGEYLAGRAGIKRDKADVELAYSLLPKFWGRGLATAAARHLVRTATVREVSADRVVAYTELHNAASRRVMDKVGLQYDRAVQRGGHLRVRYSRSLHAPAVLNL